MMSYWGSRMVQGPNGGWYQLAVGFVACLAEQKSLSGDQAAIYTRAVRRQGCKANSGEGSKPPTQRSVADENKFRNLPIQRGSSRTPR